MDSAIDIDKLSDACKICSIHVERIAFSYSKIAHLLPLSLDNYQSLEPETTSFIDQLIFRFSKLQDSMGHKLFAALLVNLGEDVKATPFIDQLNKLESLGLVQKNDWLMLRETRNVLSHEYPFNTSDVVDGINLLSEQVDLIISIWRNLEQYSYQRFPEIISKS